MWRLFSFDLYEGTLRAFVRVVLFTFGAWCLWLSAERARFMGLSLLGPQPRHHLSPSGRQAHHLTDIRRSG